MPYLLAFVLGIGAAGLAACGSTANKAMIGAANADELKAHLDDVLAAVNAHACSKADGAIRQAQSDLDQLPRETSVRLQHRLKAGLDTLARQATKECVKTTPTQPVTTATTPTVVPTTSVPTTPTVTTTTPTTTTPTTATTTIPPTNTVTTPDTGGAPTP